MKRTLIIREKISQIGWAHFTIRLDHQLDYISIFLAYGNPFSFEFSKTEQSNPIMSVMVYAIRLQNAVHVQCVIPRTLPWWITSFI